MTAMNEPWLDNKAWRGNRISSGEKYGHWVIGGFALFWNLLTLPLYWQLDEIMARDAGASSVPRPWYSILSPARWVATWVVGSRRGFPSTASIATR